MQDSLETDSLLTAGSTEEGTAPSPDQPDVPDAVAHAKKVAHVNDTEHDTPRHGLLVLYCLTQIGCVLTTGTGLALPLALVLNYHGAFHTGCHDKSAVYEAMDDWKLLGTYVSLETLVTRTWLMIEVQRCLALADGRPLFHLASADRMIWASGAFVTALLLDLGAIIGQHKPRPSVTRPTAPRTRCAASGNMQSFNAIAGMQTLHYVNTGLCAVVYVLLAFGGVTHGLTKE